jgi:hypothetical protein
MTYETFAANPLYTSTAEIDDFERFIGYVSEWLTEHDASIGS